MTENSPASTRLQAVVHGRVQGVSYRYYTQRRATQLELTGYVINQWDGTVLVVAEGSQPAVRELLAYLRVGPRVAFVTQVDTQWLAPTGKFNRFEVRH